MSWHKEAWPEPPRFGFAWNAVEDDFTLIDSGKEIARLNFEELIKLAEDLETFIENYEGK